MAWISEAEQFAKLLKKNSRVIGVNSVEYDRAKDEGRARIAYGTIHFGSSSSDPAVLVEVAPTRLKTSPEEAAKFIRELNALYSKWTGSW